jgi:hypothetical protein
MPQRISAEPTALIGRMRERGIVRDLLDRLPGQGGALVVRGEAGIGKSALQPECSRRPACRSPGYISCSGRFRRRSMPCQVHNGELWAQRSADPRLHHRIYS